ncbi:type 1 glutamine amidotransferase-like domain-containing protein [Candidatus Falkowbacteria bacterium]|jgi:dipeptidase E|nr:type 1 glutamine amidotransferase-like domain-containing protein [Candidatus Falkowbacteria bacterium]
MSNGEFFTEKVPQLVENFSKMKIAYINTATKGMPDPSALDRHIERMKELDFNFEVIDIADKNEDELFEQLKTKDLIYVQGGNTFYLLKCIRESGFDKVIKKLLQKGIIYTGASAGAYVACPTIEMATWNDSQHFDRFGITDFTALGLFPSLIKAHFTEDQRPVLDSYINNSHYKVELLADNEALMIKNGKITKFN